MNIIWRKPDGSVAVTHLTDEAVARMEEDGSNLQEYAALLQSPRTEPDGSISYQIDPSWQTAAENITLPTTREFREAWTWTTPDPVIDIDMAKAREVTKRRLRMEREPLLANLDVQFMRNLELGQDNAVVAAEKQRLRDVTKLADAAISLGDLAAIRA